MANEEHLAILRQGVEAWNAWRHQHGDVVPDLCEANLAGAKLGGAELYQANLVRADLCAADLRGADFCFAQLVGAKLHGANLRDAQLYEATIRRAGLVRANLRGATLRFANLTLADLHRADLRAADLRNAILVETSLLGADLTGCRIHGMAAWDLNLEGAKQDNLIITKHGQPEITVDNLEVAQFLYLLLHNQKIRDAIDTIGKKAVLILGRFTPERKAVLDALRDELRRRDYLPILFDFEKPDSKDLTGTVLTLAGMARFVVADLTDPRSIPHELAKVAGRTRVAIQPIILAEQDEYAMFGDLRIWHPWVLEPYRYASPEALMAALGDGVIGPAEAKARELQAPLPPGR